MKAQLATLAAVVLAAAPLFAQQGEAPFHVQESGKSFWRLDDAVKSIGGADGTILIAPGTYRDCAIQEGGRVAFQAVQPGTVILDGMTCEGKAALVLRGRESAVDGLIFRNMRVPDGNGAGIRLEKGSLTVLNSQFRDSEEGILTAEDRTGTVRIDRSTFSGLGRCDRGLSCAHSVYIGKYGTLVVTRSRFERGMGGHYVKSWAMRNDISDSSFDDTRGHTTNYMIDLSGGSVGTITRNTFVQGPDKENHSAFITVAPEARENRSVGLVIQGNRASLAPSVGWSTIFVADWSHEPLRISGNDLGKGIAPFETR
ncbi:right-handed parallel beta-helix repeat-containing protein [Flavisphingomonas formosensis]|uniref:right-handed parallel beta-helix repeat-containing protein n=1 Tax=Flavisphingomonas formosensis TaxID=861534 RepID=UPI0012FA0DC8|nr:right-handed parallel beta-helix repeat-containing protein [Sphingomonas formosensis]